MNDKVRFLRYIGYMCIVLIGLALGVLLIGYQQPTFGKVATIVLLVVGASVCFALAHRMDRERKG